MDIYFIGCCTLVVLFSHACLCRKKSCNIKALCKQEGQKHSGELSLNSSVGIIEHTYMITGMRTIEVLIVFAIRTFRETGS